MSDFDSSRDSLNGANKINQSQNFRELFRRFIFRSDQTKILIAVAAVLLLAFVFLAVVVVAQVAVSATVLTFNDTNRVFVQLQRETLRLAILAAEPIEKFDAVAVQTQSDLIESRVGVMNFPDSESSYPPTIHQRAQQIQQQWDALKQQVQIWKADPGNSTLRESLRKGLTDFELFTNDTEISYVRINNTDITDFATLNRQQLLVFAVGAIILILFMFAVAISVYRFNQQQQEVETVRESNRLKDEFLAVISHELRTPLNAIIGFLGIMQMTQTLDERNMHMVDRAYKNAQRLLALINDILDLSKIEAGKFEIIPTVVSLRNLVERWQSHVDILAKQKGLEFSAQIESTFPETVFVDDEALTKIVINLLSNAFKFTEKGSVSLQVKVSKPDEWLILVTDSGIGIAEADRTHIFESFRQADSSARRAYGGTGLGLSIVRQLCEAMGGSIQVESTLGKGSIFTVHMPLRSLPQPQIGPVWIESKL